jgi:L-rhamnose mutarotase
MAMRNLGTSIAGLMVFLFFTACNTVVKKESEPTETMVMTTDLVNDSAAISQYEYYHSSQGVWPELKKANEASGFSEIQIFRFGNRLVMMVTYPKNADLSKMDSLYVASDPKVKEWGELMSKFQQSLPGVDSSQKWVQMKLIHHYKEGNYYK